MHEFNHINPHVQGCW